MTDLSVVEICAGGGGQAIGLERAEWLVTAAVDNDPHACSTLSTNRPSWSVIERNLEDLDGTQFRGVDLLAGGLPCPPFSRAGSQSGADDERDLFPEAVRLIRECRPSAVMLENVKGFTDFKEYLDWLFGELRGLGYEPDGRLLSASDFGVPQLRPRFVIVALRPEYAGRFAWPERIGDPPTVGEELLSLMAGNGWLGAEDWARKAHGIAPTIVGGSKKHGGPDLGPQRARQAWLKLGVDGRGIADTPPAPDDDPEKLPKLTTQMVARLQGFPPDWTISGGKTAAYRQIGNAFPPPVAFAVGTAIRNALHTAVPVVCAGPCSGEVDRGSRDRTSRNPVVQGHPHA